jgi:two-component system, cell cycle response regulator
MTARILVVDDIAANRRLLEAKLNAEFYEVLLAEGGEEALSIAVRASPDVILLDVMMPGMDGFEVCRRLKGLPGTTHIPVVMITALTEPGERVRGLEAGADDFLSKPVDDSTLFARLRALLRTKQVLDAWRQRATTSRALGIEPPEAPEASLSHARVVLVGNDAAECDHLTRILGEDGLTVEQAGVEEAWDRIAPATHDLIVCGLDLPGRQALRLASRLRARAETRDLPVLLVAGPEQRDVVLRGFDLGANDHVLRPVDPNELRARARNQIRWRRYQEGLRADLDRSLELAVTDSLTGLRNRLYARRHLDSTLAEQAAAVLILDVDRFKALNDAWGHAAGDIALREVAGRLRAHVRACDVVARWGGEEFLIAMGGASAEEALTAAERLRAAVASEPVVQMAGQAPISVTVSVGIATAPRGTAVDALVQAADAALYRAKRSGRDQAVLAEPGDWEVAAAG